MTAPQDYIFPETESLARSINAALAARAPAVHPVAVTERRRASESSSFPGEIVTCAREDGRTLRLFCKYLVPRDREHHSHRPGIVYEAQVYDRVLAPLAVQAPKSFGLHSDDTIGKSWLILEYLHGALPLDRIDPRQGAILKGATWIGDFQRRSAAPLGSPSLSFLTRYDPAYYTGWADRTLDFAGRSFQGEPWLRRLCERFEEVVPLLLADAPTVVHGEYYPKNILFREDDVYPVDWETAALGAGEIDIASLTEGWSDETTAACWARYRRARWPEGPPPGEGERTLDAARLYMQLRRLGDWPEKTEARLRQKRYVKRLRAAGERLGLVEP